MKKVPIIGQQQQNLQVNFDVSVRGGLVVFTPSFGPVQFALPMHPEMADHIANLLHQAAREAKGETLDIAALKTIG